VRATAKDWKTFSSDAPFRVPIPSEEDVRGMRQLPIETDPPEHTEYRKITDPFFKRAKLPEVVAKVEELVEKLIEEATTRDKIEIVREFALPLQSHALTYLLSVPEAEAEEWIGWGTHVFRDGEDGTRKGAVLEEYIQRQLDRAAASPGDDFFSALAQAEFQGRKLTREEMAGFANLAFAGGRDTVINTVSSIIAWFAAHPADLDSLRSNPGGIVLAGEEFIRWISPLTHIGRVCPVDTNVHEKPVPSGGRVSLCWASANFDETVFDNPEKVELSRKPNPHMAFGAGTHICQGAPHARLIVRTLLKVLCEKVSRIRLLEAVDNLEQEAAYTRKNSYERLIVTLVKKP
jgi:cytochrome P450